MCGRSGGKSIWGSEVWLWDNKDQAETDTERVTSACTSSGKIAVEHYGHTQYWWGVRREEWWCGG